MHSLVVAGLQYRLTLLPMSSRLSMAAGLHAIESNNFVPPTPIGDRDFDRPSYRGVANRFWAIPPPEDPVDLSERISTLYVFACGMST